jgi:dipeptide transport system permease protein
MLRFFLSRFAVLIPTFVGVSIIAFSFIRLLPGDPVALMSGERVMSPERHAEITRQLGYDRPIVIQYLDYLGGVLTGDLGQSIVTKRPVLQEFFTLFPATLELSLCAITLAVLLGIPAGIIAAVKRGSVFDQSLMGVALIGYSMPIFWWGLLLIILFSGILQWTPVSGRISLLYYFPPVTGFMLVDALLSGQPGAFRSALSHLVLPTIVLATIPLAVIARQTRSAMLEVLGEDYVRTARAKGLSPKRVIGLHALRNALIPVITTIGLQVGVLLAGAILTETIFSWPGIGKWMVDSVFRRDYPVIQGGPAHHRRHHHAGELDGGPALRPHQPAHPSSMTDIAAPEAIAREARNARRAMLAEFWHYFSANRGALIGLAVFLLLVVAAIFAPWLAPHRPTRSSATRRCCRRHGSRVVGRSSCSARTRSGATCLPACFMARGSRFSSALWWSPLR